MSFTGEYYNSIDQKNRLSIPAKFRNSLSSGNDKTFVLSKGFDECLFLYPLEEWKIVEEQLSSLSSIKDKHRNFIRKITRHANYVRYDSQGRVAIPDLLLNYANISKEVSMPCLAKRSDNQGRSKAAPFHVTMIPRCKPEIYASRSTSI